MNEQQTLRQHLNAARFALWELHLYLDSHPGCAAARQKHAEYTEKIAQLTAEYVEKYGPLNETADTTGQVKWVCEPWPWEIKEE